MGVSRFDREKKLKARVRQRQFAEMERRSRSAPRPREEGAFCAAIERLKNSGIIAEKFYAAVLLETIDKEESRRILESLLTEKTEVFILSGDQADGIPAHQVAESMLNSQTSSQTVAPSSPIARANQMASGKLFR